MSYRIVKQERLIRYHVKCPVKCVSAEIIRFQNLGAKVVFSGPAPSRSRTRIACKSVHLLVVELLLPG